MAQMEQQAAEQIKVTVVSSSSDSNEGECEFASCTLFSVNKKYIFKVARSGSDIIPVFGILFQQLWKGFSVNKLKTL